MRRYLCLAAVLLLLLAASALSNSYNTPNIDGHVTTQTGDWQSDELAHRDPDNDNRWGSSDGDLVDLYVTWDADSLYVGVTTTNGPSSYGNGYLVFIDTDGQVEDASGSLTGATSMTSADFYQRQMEFSTIGAEVMMGMWNLEAWNYDVRDCSDPTSTTAIAEHYVDANPGWQHIELGIGWDGIFGLGPGTVPSGTKLRFICAVVGGDGSGAYDALPTSSTGYESNPGTPWDAVTDLDVYVELPVDGNGDGVPDVNYPPGGRISGTVTLDDPLDDTTVVTVTAWQNDVAVWSDTTPAGGGEYSIERLRDGFYDVVATAPSYLSQTSEDVEVAEGGETTGVDFTLQKVTGRVDGQVAVSGGPAEDVTVGVYDEATGELLGDGEYVVPGGTGSFSIGTVIDGSWLVLAEGRGYVEAEAIATISGGDTTDVGLLTLPAVVATRYGFTDSLRGSIHGTGTTVSLPADSIYYYARAWVEPRDDDDRVAYWDDVALGGLTLSATKLDPDYPPLGDVTFADPDSIELPDARITADMFVDGRAPFLVSGTAVEVLRVLASADTAGVSLRGVLEVGIDPPAPVRLELSTDQSVIPAGTGVAAISGQLVDAAGNPAQVSGVIANMTASGIGGGFSVPSPETDADGKFVTDFSGPSAGTAYVTASIDPGSPYPGLEVDELTIEIEPDAAALVEVDPDPRALPAGYAGTLSAQVVDAWGNNVAQQGLSISLSASPPTLLASMDSPIVTDAEGSATGGVEAGSGYGTVEITGTAAGVEVETVFLPIDATIRAMDEVAPESDAAHNSDAGMDLTALRISNSSEELIVGVILDSHWDGAHVGICLETKGDAAGAASEPFVFPINYGHALLPDYAFTYKFYDQSYADFRRWNTDLENWQWQDWDTGEWLTVGVDEWVSGVEAQERQMEHDQWDVYFRVPFETVGIAVGDTVRVQAYVMQEVPGDPDPVKYTALDSAPHDVTHDMLPDVGDWWDTATNPVTLSNYQSYVLREEGLAPELTGGNAYPTDDPSSTAQPGDMVTYSVHVADAGGGIGDVFLNLSDVGGERFVRMADDGARADIYARDGVYTAEEELTAAASDGAHVVAVTASDATNEASSTLGIAFDVDNPATAIRQFDDPEDDDHGPNQTDSHGDPIEGLYYEYPTNLVFPDGSFDIRSVEIFADGDRLVFRTHITELANHQDPSSADWGAPQPSAQTCDSPNRTDLNLQKIDIYIDTEEGKGATSGFPNRYVDVAAVDAWEYGIAVEGWGKWFVTSHGSNSIASWERLEDDASITMCDDHVEDYIDVSVARELLGLPDDPTENGAVLGWDIIVCLSSHDGESNRDNLGGIRWVNGTTSEWQIGGGRDGEGNRERDANIMDVAASPGEGHEPGRPQEEMLDYTTPEATARFDANKVACVIEASFAVDTSPPVIGRFQGDPELEHIPWLALDGAPAVLWTTITDVTGVETARVRWNPVGLPALVDSVDMVNLIGDVWAADIPREDVIEATNVVSLSKTGDARVLEAVVFARDASDSANQIVSAPMTFGIPEPWAASQTIAGPDTLPPNEEQLLVFQDGTVLALEDVDIGHAEGDTLEITVTPVPLGLVDVSNIRDDMEFVGVARTLDARYVDGTPLELAGFAGLTLHYPQYEVGGLNESNFGIFDWVHETERWVMRGGAASPAGNTVTGTVSDVGTYGVFYWESLDVGDSEGLSGVIVQPNPFSPNGDGIYDETIVTFFLGREADYVNVEFYDLEGRLARRLVFKEATDYTGRTPATVIWDGTDKYGEVVPYGIYVMRVEAKFKTEPTFERVNRPVVIIK